MVSLKILFSDVVSNILIIKSFFLFTMTVQWISLDPLTGCFKYTKPDITIAFGW